eukprot:CAMPEP_0117611024 /NCGR_PEP_ID=MMETSP0784-20121206/82179_1 /TAXON_ID=39447 /ORGANISM="" /LENGTH=100 /DNA_ID=CAMNT_0005414453 /DNA_START=197 /DNA_END=495 /DNA_ORIENTATION=+
MVWRAPSRQNREGGEPGSHPGGRGHYNRERSGEHYSNKYSNRSNDGSGGSGKPYQPWSGKSRNDNDEDSDYNSRKYDKNGGNGWQRGSTADGSGGFRNKT